MNQGKTPKQREDSAKLFVAGVIIIILMTIVLFIHSVIGDFRP